MVETDRKLFVSALMLRTVLLEMLASSVPNMLLSASSSQEPYTHKNTNLQNYRPKPNDIGALVIGTGFGGIRYTITMTHYDKEPQPL